MFLHSLSGKKFHYIFSVKGYNEKWKVQLLPPCIAPIFYIIRVHATATDIWLSLLLIIASRHRLWLYFAFHDFCCPFLNVHHLFSWWILWRSKAFNVKWEELNNKITKIIMSWFILGTLVRIVFDYESHLETENEYKSVISGGKRQSKECKWQLWFEDSKQSPCQVNKEMLGHDNDLRVLMSSTLDLSIDSNEEVNLTSNTPLTLPSPVSHNIWNSHTRNTRFIIFCTNSFNISFRFTWML